MSKPPLSPYPPDPDPSDDVATKAEFGHVVDLVASDLDWSGRRGLGLSATRVEFRRCRWTGAELAEASLRDVVFEECRLDLVGLRYARLERVVFRDCRLAESDLYGATMKDVLFQRCELREAIFSSVALQRVELRRCDLTGLRGVEALRGVRMPWCDVIENAALVATALGIEIID